MSDETLPVIIDDGYTTYDPDIPASMLDEGSDTIGLWL